MKRRVAIKIGSNVITDTNGQLDLNHMSHLVEQIIALRNHDTEVILISSGAVAAGRSMVQTDHKLDVVAQRQLFASTGQIRLMNIYSELFEYHQTLCAQVLVTKEDFRTRMHYLNIQVCIDALLQNNVVPIINENDVISVTELMFTDNDELASLISDMMDAETLFILSNIDGIYDGNPNDTNSKLITLIEKELPHVDEMISTKRSNFGRGGMITKYTMARKAAQSGIHVYIANGKRPNIVSDIFLEDKPVPYTYFKPIVSTKESKIKRWISYSSGFAKGEIVINAGATAALKSSKATSLLMIGVARVTGEFKQGDVIKVLSEDGVCLGYGKTQYHAEAAKEAIGKKDIKPIVHYDYLYLID